MLRQPPPARSPPHGQEAITPVETTVRIIVPTIVCNIVEEVFEGIIKEVIKEGRRRHQTQDRQKGVGPGDRQVGPKDFEGRGHEVVEEDGCKTSRRNPAGDRNKVGGCRQRREAAVEPQASERGRTGEEDEQPGRVDTAAG